ncbi:MAG: putative lipid II flippase FtsW [Elusimicrobia bacterium]|nr:putative lipid II flippase FtsW [Elusimicrobiota bacterium]
MKFKRSGLAVGDPWLIGAFAILIIMGAVMVFSSSSIMAGNRFGDVFYYLRRHLIYLTMGLVAMFFGTRLKMEVWRKLWLPLYVATFCLLILTLGLGRSVGGAKRWLYLGPLGFQGSELAKLVLIVALARYLDRYHSKLDRLPWALAWPALIFVVLVLPVVWEPDFGNPVVMALVFFTMILASEIPWRFFLVYPLAAIPAVIFLVNQSPYRVKRLIGFLSLWRGGLDAGNHGATYQIAQALLALGSGGLLGKGLGDSELKLHYLPQPHTDFVFPVIGEELGFAGSVLVIGLFAIVTIRGLRAALKSQWFFERHLALGITFCLSYQAAIHMAVTTALAPTKGITLPFISYGGSSLITCCLMAGILIGISRREPMA